MVLTGSEVLAVSTFALLRVARNSSLVALAVVLLALRCFTLTPLEVLALVFGHFVLESFNISLEDIFDGFPPLIVVFVVIMTFGPRCSLALAVRSTGSSVPQAFTV